MIPMLRNSKIMQNVVQSCLRMSPEYGCSVPLPRLVSYKVQNLDDFNERVKNSKVPVIVDFFATWCKPCNTLTPRIESLVNELNGKVDLAKVDIDENSALALDYDVSAIPVLIAIKDGKVSERLVGLQDVDKLRTFIEKAVFTPEDTQSAPAH